MPPDLPLFYIPNGVLGGVHPQTVTPGKIDNGWSGVLDIYHPDSEADAPLGLQLPAVFLPTKLFSEPGSSVLVEARTALSAAIAAFNNVLGNNQVEPAATHQALLGFVHRPTSTPQIIEAPTTIGKQYELKARRTGPSPANYHHF